jgi:SAM-dependent methyltransferase
MVEGLYERDYFTKDAYHDPEYFDFPVHEVRVNKLVEITRPLSVLDVGCAYGFIVRRLLDKGIPATGCDVSRWAQKKAEGIIPGNFQLCPAWELPYHDKQFDVVYCEGVLEHIPEGKIEQVFREFSRVGERCYLQISLAEHPQFAHEPGHVCCHDANWWFERIPNHSWMFLSPTGTDGGNMWLYKG